MTHKKIQIYYTVESRFWRHQIGNKFDNLTNGTVVDYLAAFVNTKQEFRHPSPIEARNAAFSYYQSMIEVLYEGLGKEYTSDYQARIDLQHYLDSGNAVEIGGKTKVKISDDLLNGIEVFMVVEESGSLQENIENSKYCIHGIRYIDYQERLDEDLIDNLKSLITEYKLYESNSYSIGKEIVFKNFGDIGGEAEVFMKTPFDWDIFMQEFEGINLLQTSINI